jgi:hypothetical protein
MRNPHTAPAATRFGSKDHARAMRTLPRIARALGSESPKVALFALADMLMVAALEWERRGGPSARQSLDAVFTAAWEYDERRGAT